MMIIIIVIIIVNIIVCIIVVISTNIVINIIMCIITTIVTASAASMICRGCATNHRWNRSPRPQPQTLSKLVFLIYLS